MRKPYSQYFSNQTKELQKITALLVILIIASIGTYILTGSHAATPYANVNADNGTTANGATAQTCSGASDSNCVVFKGTTTGTLSCTTTISSGLAAAINSAAAGAVICLNTGSYGAISVNTTKASMVTIMPAAGQSPTLGNVDVASSSNLTFTGMKVGGATVGVSGGSAATHIHFTHDTFTDTLCINTPQDINQDTLIDSSTFNNLGESCTEGRIGVAGDNVNHSKVNGVVFTNNVIGNGGAADGIQINGGAYGTQIGPGNEFVGIEESGCGAVHCDAIQFYGAENTLVTGNYFHNDSDAVMSPDGNGNPVTITNNVIVYDGNSATNTVQFGGQSGDTVSHNTFANGASLRFGKENTSTCTSGETVTNNIMSDTIAFTEGCSSSGDTIDYNLIPGGGGGTHGISGSPTFTGGGNPGTWAGYMLTSGSLGHVAGSDGKDLGSNYFGP